MANPLTMRRPSGWSTSKWMRWHYLWFLPTKREMWSASVDARLRLRGYCARNTPQGSGGYAHWRCMSPRGHRTAHRYGNYVWVGPGARAQYRPLPEGMPWPDEIQDGYKLTRWWLTRVRQDWREARRHRRDVADAGRRLGLWR